MEAIKSPFREKVEKHLRKLTGEPEAAEGDCDGGSSGSASIHHQRPEMSEQDDSATQEQIRERQEKIRLMQARRRSERANFREEMRRKHKLKSCQQDRELALHLAELQQEQDDDVTNGSGKVTQVVVSMVKGSWQKIKTSITTE